MRRNIYIDASWAVVTTVTLFLFLMRFGFGGAGGGASGGGGAPAGHESRVGFDLTRAKKSMGKQSDAELLRADGGMSTSKGRMSTSKFGLTFILVKANIN